MSSVQRIISLLDLTSLNELDTDAAIRELCRKAVTIHGPVAAVCIWPRFVKLAKFLLKGSPVKIATVVNFPAGESIPAAVIAEVQAALQDGADEIDVVFPYGAFLNGDVQRVEAVLNACKTACGKAPMKVILESGAFPDLSFLGKACQLAIACGADFLKTSTGKRQPGATLEAAEVMLQSCKNAPKIVGFKASGGIRDKVTALSYLAVADRIMGPTWTTPQTFRFGASGLLDLLLQPTSSSASVLY